MFCPESKAKYYVPIKMWMSSALRIHLSLPLVDLSQLHSIRSPIVQARVTANVTPAAVIAFKKPVSRVSEISKQTNVNRKLQLDATICRHLFTAKSLYSILLYKSF